MNIEMRLIDDVENKNNGLDYLDDTELVRRFKMGDESAFSHIVIKYQRRLLRVAQTILGDENEAMDLSQEAFVKAYFNIKNYKGNSSLYTWLYRILYNLCLSSLRRKKIISFLSLDSQEKTEDIVSPLPDPSQECERRELKTAINNALNKLPLRQRTVFIMKQIEGLKHEDIAQVMGITEGAVKSSYFHAVHKLKRMLINYGEEYELR